MSTLVIEEAGGPLLGDAWAAMTFPLFRPLLALLGTDRATSKGTRAVAAVARAEAMPVGLALAEVPVGPPTSAELLSLYVSAPWRRQGLATRLVERVEETLARLGVAEVTAVYLSGKPSTEAVERIAAHRGFSAPQLRKIVVRLTPEQAERMDWWQRARLPHGCTIFPWGDLAAADHDAIRRSNAERPWIPELLAPWSCSPHFDPVTSVGLRRGDEVVGWVITHRLAPRFVRYTNCFVRAELQWRGALFPMLVASATPLLGTGTECTFVTTAQFPEMVRLTQRRFAPFVTYCGETRGVSKRLRPLPASPAPLLPQSPSAATTGTGSEAGA